MTLEIAQRVELVFAADLPTRAEVERLCVVAVREGYRSVTVPSGAILLAQHFLDQSEIKISCRVGFPDGAIDADVKRYETEFAIDTGVNEIDLMPSLARIKDGDLKGLLREIRDVVEAADERPVKVALELSRWETSLVRGLVQVVLDSGAQYICANGLGELHLVSELCGSEFRIIAAVKSVADAAESIEAGASLVALPQIPSAILGGRL